MFKEFTVIPKLSRVGAIQVHKSRILIFKLVNFYIYVIYNN